MQAFRLDGKVAVVTGGGSGIGHAIALMFASQGAVVNVLEVNTDQAESTVLEIKRQGGTAYAYSCDISKQHDVEVTFADVQNARGKIDILVNNAGIAHIGTAETTSEEDFDRIYSVNVKGVFFCLKAGLPLLVKNGGGVVLNIASIASLIGLPDRFAYSMSKGAVLTMTYSVAADYLKKNVRCNCICPARIHTPFVDGFLKKNYPGEEQKIFDKLSAAQPIGRMGKPEEVAALALYLCSDASSFLTGAAYPLDGGVMSLR